MATTEEVELEKKDPHECCPAMKAALDHAQREHQRDRPRPVGLAVGQMYARPNFHFTGERVIYHIPGSGNGKARVKAFYIVCSYCPFCGKELKHVQHERGEGERDEMVAADDA